MIWIRNGEFERIRENRACLFERDTMLLNIGIPIEDVLEPYRIQQGLLMRTPRGGVATRSAYLHFGLVPPREGAPRQQAHLFPDQD